MKAKNWIKISSILIFILAFSGLSHHIFFSQKPTQTDSAAKPMVLAASSDKPAKWNIYENDFYGFKLQYPSYWNNPQEEAINDPDYNYIFRVSFGTDQGFNGDSAEGFSVFVYRGNMCLSSFDSMQISDNNPDVPLANSIANNINNHPGCVSRKITATSDVFPRQVDIYQYAGKNYTFVIIPFMSRNENLSDHIINQFSDMAKTFVILPKDQIQANTIGTNNPTIKNTAVPSRPRSTMICPDPSQKPTYSKTKGKHMDEDCCPDPDEWPNPQCSYNAASFKILLAGPSSKKK